MAQIKGRGKPFISRDFRHFFIEKKKKKKKWGVFFGK